MTEDGSNTGPEGGGRLDRDKLVAEFHAGDWVSAPEALRLAVQMYSSVGSDPVTARADAIAAFEFRLRSAKMLALAPKWYSSTKDQLNGEVRSFRQQSSEELGEQAPGHLIEPLFWGTMAFAREEEIFGATRPKHWTFAKVYADWVAGDFEYYLEMTVKDGGERKVTTRAKALSVFFHKSGLPTSHGDMQSINPSAQDCVAERDGNETSIPRIAKAARDQRARVPAAQLRRWWLGLGDHSRAKAQDDLLMLARSAFSDHQISRDRIRELAGPRKRGPKPIRGKTTA